MVLFLVPTILLWSFFWIPYFRISNIQIGGGDDMPKLKSFLLASLASTNAAFIPKNNFFFVSPSKIATLIKENGSGIAEVSKELPGTLIIKFPLQTPWLIFCKEKDICFYVSQNGILTDMAPRFSENPLPTLKINLPEAELGGEAVPPEIAGRIFRFSEDLKTIDAAFAEVEIENDIKIETKEGWQIYLDKNFDPTKIFIDLSLLLQNQIKDGRKNLEYVDMRFENKAFYKKR